MLLLLVCVLLLPSRFASSTPDTPEVTSICGEESEVHLQAQGEAASQSVQLEPNDTKPLSLCRLKVTAPKSHVVNLQFFDVLDQNQLNETDANKDKKDSCFMSIYLPDNTKAPFWKGDPCSGEKMADVDLLTSEFNILWSPPDNLTTPIYHKNIVLTAVGSGPFCKDPFQHTCMRIGRIPMLCISDHLLCDGVPNCPKSSTNSDEDPKMCNTAKNAWENFVVELVKKYRTHDPRLKANSTDVPSEWFVEWQLGNKNNTNKPEVVNETHSATESISAMLNKYGPWGYLMMGLLICGTVLFFCGLWECCCKRPKPEGDPPPITTPTTVLIMNCDSGTAAPMPPQYDDLDLPPPYTTLFPGDVGRYTSIIEGEVREPEVEEPVPCSSSDVEKNDVDLNQSGQSVQIETTVQINSDFNETGSDASQQEEEEEITSGSSVS